MMNEVQQKIALRTMRFQLSEIKNFEDMVWGRGSPSTYTQDDVKMYIRGIKDNAESFFKHTGLSETEENRYG